MARLPRREPYFVNESEKAVWEELLRQLGPDDLALPNVRLHAKGEDLEVDFVVCLAGIGVVAVEVKGSGVDVDDDGWLMRQQNGRVKRIDPVEQVRRGMYAFRDALYRDPRWGYRSRVRFGYMVVTPFRTFSDDVEKPDFHRWQLTDRTELPELVARLKGVFAESAETYRALDLDDIDTIESWIAGAMPRQRDLLVIADDHEAYAERLTQAQGSLLDAVRLLNRAQITGGPGSGKTWMAMEQARRRSKAGDRVALLCYSRGLASFLQRRAETLDRKERPAYIGTFHGLGAVWGADIDEAGDTDYWERQLPDEMLRLSPQIPVGQKFDAVVVDEVQDFADAWWEVLLSALKDPEEGRIYVFSDEGQRVFPRFAEVPIPMPTLLLSQNLRNTRQIAESFQSLGAFRMQSLGGDGPEVRFVECSPEAALDVADDEVDALLDVWRPGDVALLTVGSRHPNQTQWQELLGQDGYWDKFWDADEVFYGHVLGFKGLERRVVVLALNGGGDPERARERLYVGLSRATEQLVVCGDPDYIRDVAGEGILARLRG